MAQVKTMRSSFVAKKVFWKSVSDSEHSDSEFCYPGKLLNVKML